MTWKRPQERRNYGGKSYKLVNQNWNTEKGKISGNEMERNELQHKRM
jgi:hypothetical protein